MIGVLRTLVTRRMIFGALIAFPVMTAVILLAHPGQLGAVGIATAAIFGVALADPEAFGLRRARDR
jgi:hypothetical protein